MKFIDHEQEGVEGFIDLSHEDEPMLEKLLKFLYQPEWKPEVYSSTQDGYRRECLQYARLHDLSKRLNVPGLATLALMEFEDDLVQVKWGNSVGVTKVAFAEVLPALVALVYSQDMDNESLRKPLVRAVARLVKDEDKKDQPELEGIFASHPKFAVDLVMYRGIRVEEV